MGEGIQITIPDFDDDDYGSTTTTPFGRSATSAFGFSFGGSGLDSPTIATPSADRHERFFTSHSRMDSVTSDDSMHSVTTRMSKPFHSSSSSIATSATAFSKKPSFASIRNAFKSGKNNHSETPPLPSIEQYGEPVLKNPFNRSTSSLNQSSKTAIGAASPPFRPPTPSSKAQRTKQHGKSQHSQTGSIFYTSDGGSDYGHGYSSSPPPVPRMPNAFGQNSRSETPPTDYEEDKIVVDPKTPSDYALHAVFMRFARIADSKIEQFLRQQFHQEPTLLHHFIGPGIDSEFDETLSSLAKIAQRHTKPVLDSIMRWRRGQQEEISSELIGFHTSDSPPTIRAARDSELSGLLSERKSLIAIYIMCRALIAVMQTISKDALGDAVGYRLEESTFEQFRKPDLKLSTQSANHRINSELYATLLGHIANVRFTSVTDRFLAELGPVAHGQVLKDLDMKYDKLIRGLKHIQIKVWPPESFEEGAEFMETLSKSFGNAHGLRLKTTFAETLTHILHPIGKARHTAQAETNNPQWAKAIEIIYPKAREMMSKPRYWPVAFPLAITSLCVAPQAYFLKNWVLCFEAACSKLKEKPWRTAIMNGVMRLIWTYLYRCQESASATTTRLDSLLKHFFPVNRLTISPSDERLEPFIYIVHFILSRHFDFGKELCLDLLHESLISPLQQQNGSIGSVLAFERISIAVQAILLSLHVIEKESGTPTWPSSADFSTVPPRSDYPTSSEVLSVSLLSKPCIKEFFDRCGITLAAIVRYCFKNVGSMSLFDEQWSISRFHLATYEEAHNYITRQHANGPTVVYPSSCTSQIDILEICFQSWPRLLHPTIPLDEALNILFRGVVHADPTLAERASEALKRFMADPVRAPTVLLSFTKFLFSPSSIAKEGKPVQLLVTSSNVLALWVDFVDVWIRGLLSQKAETFAEEKQLIMERCTEIVNAALFLLAHENRNIHATGVEVVRLMGLLADHLRLSASPGPTLVLVDYLHGKGVEKTYLWGYDDLLEGSELLRLEQWRESKRIDLPLRIADSTNERDRKLWHFVYPAFLQQCMDLGAVLGPFRESVMAAGTRLHPTIALLAGLSNRIAGGLPNRTASLDPSSKNNKPLVDQWRLWVKVLCATASFSEAHRPVLTQLGREHTRAQSDASFERERLSTTRGLFRYLTPFLDSEHTEFRDAAVVCISIFPSNAYPQLLEDLSLIAGRQFYDDPRAKPGPLSVVEQNVGIHANRQFHDDARSKPGSSVLTERTRRQERLHSAVAHIYYLTAPYLLLQRSAGRQAALANVLKFVRTTQTFLSAPEMRKNFTLQRLRRYFCGTVERLFDGLAALKDSDRFIPSNMHLTLYRLCEEWCQLGPQAESIKQRQRLMQSAAADSVPRAESQAALERFDHDTTLLSHAAVGALASLCQKAFFPPDMSSGSPTTERPVVFPEYSKPLTSVSILERLSGILSSSYEPNQTQGKKALKSLLSCNAQDGELLTESLKRAVVLTSETDTWNGRFFEVVSEVVCINPTHGFSFAQVVCLGLSNLRHPALTTRRHAFNMLEAIHQQSSGLLPLWNFEATVGSFASSTFVHAHRMISDSLSGEHPHQAIDILIQFATWLPQLPEVVSATNVTILILQSLEFWIPNIELMPEDRSNWSSRALSALYHLVSLTYRYGQTHPEQILVIWRKLVESSHPANGHAAVRFLLEQSHKVGSTIYVDCAANIVSSLCQTSITRQIFEELCSVIEPARMLPIIEHKLSFPEAQDMELWDNLDALFAEEPRLSLGPAQFAWLFLADVSIQRCWEMDAELPILLHALFTHLDHRHPYVRRRAQRMLFQCLRSWAPGYDELVERSANPGRINIKTRIDHFERDAEKLYWKDDENAEEVEGKMKSLSSRVLELLSPLSPKLVEEWGKLALAWGTTCSIRATAFRSLQIFRALMPKVIQKDVAVLLGRLSNTISAEDENLQSFTTELLRTLTAQTTSGDVNWILLPQIFWCTCACLSTTNEDEFSQVLVLLEMLLTKIDLDDQDTVELLISKRPKDWQGPFSLQPPLLKGLRSKDTSAKTLRILQTLSAVQDDRLIDPSGGRVRDLYTFSLPWCLQAMASDKPEEEWKEFASNISKLAVAEGRQSIQKIMMSFAKSHFRTRDDFLRQSVSSLREHYGVDHWTEIVTLLLGLVLNRERWLQIQAMQVLKVLFQQRETRSPFELLGSELLMPLLRLLETDLAPNALDVLEEPMTMSGGLPAKHVLRMSMHGQGLPEQVDNNPASAATVFGIPKESGWCVAQADQLRETCRANLMGVFDTCSIATRPSRIDFEPEVEALASLEPAEEDLSGLVKDLHELSSFFQGDESFKSSISLPPPNKKLEARVAAILAKSTAQDTVNDTPQTPFVDVFRIGGMNINDDLSVSDESDDDSDTDSELDAFIFDSPTAYRSPPSNGFKFR